MDENITNKKVNKATARRYGKRVLAVRAMAGETAWLDGRIMWLDGRVAWESDRGIVVPNVAMLALAQRRLGQIKSYPRSANRAFGDASEWLAARLGKLELAKRLQTISEPDIPDLVEKAHKDGHALARLVALLPAEAYCLNALPVSPGEAVVGCGVMAVTVLCEMAGDEEAPPAGRALAAMALGAVHMQRIGDDTQAIARPRWNARAYSWGLKHGWPGDAPLVVSLLAEDDGDGLAERLARVEREGSRFLLPVEDLRGLLARGIDASLAVELCEACAAMEPIAVRLMHYRDRLEGISLHWRREVAAQLQNERLAWVADLIELVRTYALDTLDPALIYKLAQFMGMMLDLGSITKEVVESALAVLKRGLELPVDLRRPFFDLLLERFGAIWTAEDLAEAVKKQPKGLSDWCYRLSIDFVYPISRLLMNTRAPDIVREALDERLVSSLSFRAWKDPDLHRLALHLVRDLGLRKPPWALENILDCFSSAKEARLALNPLAAAIMRARNTKMRGRLAESIFDAIWAERPKVNEEAPGLVRHVPRLIRFLESPGIDGNIRSRVSYTAVILNHAVGDEAPAWLDELLAYLEALGRQGELGNIPNYTLNMTLPFLVTVAAGGRARFGELVRAALAHSFDYDSTQIEKSLSLLKRFPALRDALARLFPLQPHRCLALAVKMGLVARLGKDAAAPLGYLEESSADEELPEEWEALVSAAPGAEVDARAYLRARRLLGGTTDVPPGVRKALAERQKLADELAFLEKKLVAEPGQAAIAKRVDNLRVRLSNEGKLTREVRAEVEERMAQISAEVQIEAAEAKMLECYKVRLEELAGMLPPDLQITDDLVNAILLTGDIDSNRKLLLKLLKAYLKGEKRWHERHPGNSKFLEQLAARGIDVGAWLGASPKRYVCKGVAGGKVRLVLERDPLRVLQMGNYFDTCLSFGQFNSFSTVANACELNKRVIYAYDGMGRVVGRKLIGIDSNGKLVGFHTYSTLGEDEGKALRDIFRRYCADFATGCGLELADDGTVQRLFAAEWYDDGAVPWNDDDALPPRLRKDKVEENSPARSEGLPQSSGFRKGSQGASPAAEDEGRSGVPPKSLHSLIG